MSSIPEEDRPIWILRSGKSCPGKFYGRKEWGNPRVREKVSKKRSPNKNRGIVEEAGGKYRDLISPSSMMTQRFWILLKAHFLFGGRLHLILVGGGSGGTVIAKHSIKIT